MLSWLIAGDAAAYAAASASKAVEEPAVAAAIDPAPALVDLLAKLRDNEGVLCVLDDLTCPRRGCC